MCWRVGFFGKLWRLKTLSDVAGFDVDFIAYGSILVVIYIYIQFKFSDCVKKYIQVYLEVCMYLWCTSIYPEMHRCTCTYPYYRFYFLGYEMEGPLNALGNKPLPSVLSKLVLYSFIHSCDVGWIIAYIPCANKLEHQSHSCNMYNQIVWCNILIYLLHIYTHTRVFIHAQIIANIPTLGPTLFFVAKMHSYPPSWFLLPRPLVGTVVSCNPKAAHEQEGVHQADWCLHWRLKEPDHVLGHPIVFDQHQTWISTRTSDPETFMRQTDISSVLFSKNWLRYHFFRYFVRVEFWQVNNTPTPKKCARFWSQPAVQWRSTQ